MIHPDLNNLENSLVPFAKQMLAKSGELYPFGVTMTSSGEVVACAAHDSKDFPESSSLIEMMIDGIRVEAKAGGIRASAICFDVLTIPPGRTDKTDAICVNLEHTSGESYSVYVPYKKGWLGKIQYGDSFAIQREPQIFVRN